MRFRLWMFTVATAALAAIVVQAAFQPLAQTPQVTEADAVTIVGSVVDENLAPVVGARVTLKQGGAVVSTATTGADGSFRLARIAPGDYRVSAESSGFDTITRDVHVRSGAASLRLPLVLTRPGAQRQMQEVVSSPTGVVGGISAPPVPGPSAAPIEAPQMKQANSAGGGRGGAAGRGGGGGGVGGARPRQ